MIYFNSGWISPLSEGVLNTIETMFRKEMALGPASLEALKNASDLERRCREDFSELLSCDAEDIVLTHGTRDGINHVLETIQWHKDDKIVTTSLEHPALSKGLAVVAERNAVDIHTVEIIECNTAIEAQAKLMDAITALKPRLVAVSHVQYMWGLQFSIDEIASLVHGWGGVLLIDGAQSVGLIPVNLRGNAVDFYAVSGQKRLGGPSGTGALFVRNLSRSQYMNETNCFRYLRNRHLSEHSAPLVAGLCNAIEDVLSGDIAKQLRRIEELELLLRRNLSVESIQIVGASTDRFAGMLAVRIDGIDAKRLQEWLEYHHRIVVRRLPKLNAIRICIDKTHTSEDILRMAEVLHSASAQTLN